MYLADFADGSDALCDRFDRVIGLNYVMARWHSGQWSVGYRLLSRTSDLINPPNIRSNRDENQMARHYAARYLAAVRKRIKRNAW